MADRVDVDVIVEAIAKGFDRVERDLKDLGDEGEDLEQKMDRGSSGVSALNVALGNMAAEGLMKAGRAIFQFGVDSITAASDVEEMSSKFNAVFKELSSSTEAELANMADTINRSKFDLMEYAATIQDTFVPLGFARDMAADMSVKVVALAEDLASFNNIDTATVVRDLQSALVGNTETLRKYGVVAQQVQIEAEALTSGLWDGEGAMDAQTKAAAILSLTIKGTTDAQGDALLTADSFANKQKGLEAAMKDVQVVIGELLLPAMSDLVDFAIEAAERLSLAIGQDYGQEVANTSAAIRDEKESLKELSEAAFGVEEAWNSLGVTGRLIPAAVNSMSEATQGLAQDMAAQADSFEEWEEAIKNSFGPETQRHWKTYLRYQILTKDQWYEQAKAADTLERSAAKLSRRNEEIAANVKRWTEEQESATEAVEEADVALWDIYASTGAYDYVIGEAIYANEGFARSLERSNDELKLADIATQKAMDALKEYNAFMGDEFLKNLDLTDEQMEGVNGQFLTMLDQAGAGPEILRLFATSLFDVSDEAAQAAFELMIFEANMRGLAQAVADGDVPMHNALDTFYLIRDGTFAAWEEAAKYVEMINGELIPAFDAMDGRTANMDVFINVHGQDILASDIPLGTIIPPDLQQEEDVPGGGDQNTIIVNVDQPASVTDGYNYGESIGDKILDFK